jgi:hypothetical protein
MADATVLKRFYRERAGGRTRCAWPQGRLPHDSALRLSWLFCIVRRIASVVVAQP